MGVEAYMVATSLIGIVAQRLTKVLCPECKKPRMSTEEENELMGLDHSVQVYDPCGCPKCNNTGYKGKRYSHSVHIEEAEQHKVCIISANYVPMLKYCCLWQSNCKLSE